VYAQSDAGALIWGASFHEDVVLSGDGRAVYVSFGYVYGVPKT
jgi:hypothetical protein